MTMVQRLVPHGEGMALVLDRAVLDELKIDGETPLSVSVTGNTLVVTPAPDEVRRKRFEDAKRDTFSKYDDVFRRLAE